jgi:nicotinic acid mononucleotide adenylyltransferase
VNRDDGDDGVGEVSERLVARIESDPYWSWAWRRYGDLGVLLGSGFFDDGLGAPCEVDVHWLGTPYSKIVDNLGDAPAGAEIAVLLCAGAFSPLHEGHLAMMNLAKEALEAEGVFVAGGYFSPSHDSYVSTKYPDALSGAQRVSAAQRVLSANSWVMVDPWEASVGRSLNFTDVTDHLIRYLGNLFGDGTIRVYYIFGSDNAGMFRAFGEIGDGVCIERPGYPGALEVRDEVGRGRVVGSGLSVSSTILRTREWPVTARGSGTGVYVVNDDIEFAARQWGVAGAKLDGFRTGLLAALQTATGGMAAINFFSSDELMEVQSSLVGDVINMNGTMESEHNLGVSRVFELGGGQIWSRRMGARPESGPLAEQAAKIPPGSYVMVDDDSVSGVLLDFAKSQLPHCVIRGSWLGVEHFYDRDSILDVVDAKDFLLGSGQGGLVVDLVDGEVGRVPYMWPYVSLWSRASVLPELCVEFSRAAWALNEEFFSGTEIRVGDLGGPTQKVLELAGFAESDSAQSVSRWHRKRCELALGIGV